MTPVLPIGYTQDMNEMMESLVIEILPWVDQDNREVMIESITQKLGAEAGELLSHLYQIHRINGTGD